MASKSPDELENLKVTAASQNPSQGAVQGMPADKHSGYQQQREQKKMTEIVCQGTSVEHSNDHRQVEHQQNMGQVDGKSKVEKSSNDETIHDISGINKINLQGIQCAPTPVKEFSQTASGKQKAEGQQQQHDAKKVFSRTMIITSKVTANSDLISVPKDEYETNKKLLEDRLKEINDKEKCLKEMEERYKKLKGERDVLKYTKMEELKQKDIIITSWKSKLEEEQSKTRSYIDNLKAKHERHLAEERSDMDRNIRDLHSTIQDLIKERDDIRDRFSKVAGSKLTDGNPNIADLSDPNRAMKISERFGALYDDQWTDAFQYLTGKLKKSSKDAITFLLQLLKECFETCTNLAQQQMDCLNNILLYPCQNLAKSIGANVYHKNTPCIGHQELISLKALRKAIAKHGTTQVKTEVVDVVKNKYKQTNDRKVLEECKTYLETCAEICWLMALNDPPLCLELSAKQGDRMDDKIYSGYSASGDKIDYLVWPPLLNGAGGGLLSKGVVETIKSAKTKK